MNDKDFTYDDLKEVLSRNGKGLFEGAMLINDNTAPRIWLEGIKYDDYSVKSFNKFLELMDCKFQDRRDNMSCTKYAGYIVKK